MFWGHIKSLDFGVSNMGGAGSSNSQKLNADNAESIEIVTETRNIGAQYSFIDFQGGKVRSLWL